MLTIVHKFCAMLQIFGKPQRFPYAGECVYTLMGGTVVQRCTCDEGASALTHPLATTYEHALNHTTDMCYAERTHQVLRVGTADSNHFMHVHNVTRVVQGF
jgi:hypothetical protein